MKKILILSSFILSILIITDVSACSVGPDWSADPKVHLESSDVVFVGTVKDFKHEGDINGTFIITFDVEKEYKGFVGNPVEIKTGSNSAMCGYDDPETFEKGSIWSIYATKDFNTSSIVANKRHDSVSKAI